MSGYRDEDEAAFARNTALQDEVAALKAENEALKQRSNANASPAPQKKTKQQKRDEKQQAREAAVAMQPRTTWQPPQTPGGAIAFTFVASVVLVGIHGALCVLRGFPPSVGLGILCFTMGGGGAIAVASTGYYALHPHAKLVARDPHSNEPYEVQRSPAARRTLAYVSLGVYVLGLVLTFVFGKPDL